MKAGEQRRFRPIGGLPQTKRQWQRGFHVRKVRFGEENRPSGLHATHVSLAKRAFGLPFPTLWKDEAAQPCPQTDGALVAGTAPFPDLNSVMAAAFRFHRQPSGGRAYANSQPCPEAAAGCCKTASSWGAPAFPLKRRTQNSEHIVTVQLFEMAELAERHGFIRHQLELLVANAVVHQPRRRPEA